MDLIRGKELVGWAEEAECVAWGTGSMHVGRVGALCSAKEELPTPSCPVTQNGGCTGLGVLPSKLNRSWHKLPKGSLVLTNLSAEKMEVLGQTTSLGSVQMR